MSPRAAGARTVVRNLRNLWILWKTQESSTSTLWITPAVSLWTIMPFC